MYNVKIFEESLCWKSILESQIKEYLKNNHITRDKIVSTNFTCNDKRFYYSVIWED